MRHCGLCHRDVHDPDEHELVTVPTERGLRPLRYHVCKRLVTISENAARDLVTGERRVLKRFVPEKTVEGPDGPVTILDIQRTAMNRTRTIHIDSLKAQDAAA